MPAEGSINNAALVVALASLCACATVSQRQEPSGNFLVLERPDAAKIQHEQAVAGVGGTMIGADTVISGSVTEFGRSIGAKSGFLSSTKLQTARVPRSTSA